MAPEAADAHPARAREKRRRFGNENELIRPAVTGWRREEPRNRDNDDESHQTRPRRYCPRSGPAPRTLPCIIHLVHLVRWPRIFVNTGSCIPEVLNIRVVVYEACQSENHNAGTSPTLARHNGPERMPATFRCSKRPHSVVRETPPTLRHHLYTLYPLVYLPRFPLDGGAVNPRGLFLLTSSIKTTRMENIRQRKHCQATPFCRRVKLRYQGKNAARATKRVARHASLFVVVHSQYRRPVTSRKM